MADVHSLRRVARRQVLDAATWGTSAQRTIWTALGRRRCRRDAIRRDAARAGAWRVAFPARRIGGGPNVEELDRQLRRCLRLDVNGDGGDGGLETDDLGADDLGADDLDAVDLGRADNAGTDENVRSGIDPDNQPDQFPGVPTDAQG